MSVSLSFSFDRMKRLSTALMGMTPEMKKQIKEATLLTQSISVKQFLSVSDGDPVTERRSHSGGLRARTGFLRRGVQVAFREVGTQFEGAVGTNVPYGAIHERRYQMGKANKRGLTFGFLKPALDVARPKIREMIHTAIVGKMNEVNG